jgi:hypothetical protein
MDLPLKLELPKLTHSNAIVIILPFIPGLTLVVGLAVNDPTLTHSIRNIGLGYKTELWLTVALTYILGLAMIHLVDAVTSPIYGFFVKEKYSGYPNAYWRRLARTYVGDSLVPNSEISQEEIALFVKQFGALAKEATDSLTKLDESIIFLQEHVNKGNVAVATLRQRGMEIDPTITVALSTLSNALTKNESLKRMYLERMGQISAEHEWFVIYRAVGWLEGAEDPFNTFGALALSLQTASFAMIWLMIYTGRLWGVSVGAFCFGLAIAASQTRWKVYKLANLQRKSGVPEIAALIKALKRDGPDSKPEESSESQN